jgi:diguanylate cyclase (GGDEF)-like protein
MPNQYIVLVVDDDPDKRLLLKAALQMAGWEVRTADDGEAGLAAVTSYQPDLIITDVMMPRMDGYELARRVRANPLTRFIPIIIQTALRSDAQDERRGAEVGALGYTVDPTDIDLLLARARTLLDFKNYLDTCEEAAFTDDLTHIGNRRRFKSQMEREVTRSLRYGSPFCLYLIEVDNFARLNDVYGRQAGEEVLCCVADTLLKGVRAIDTCVRLEQALFAIILPEETHERILDVAERLRLAIEMIAVTGVTEPIKTSFGIAEFPTAAQNALGLLEAAHLALAQAKQSRKVAFVRALTWIKNFVNVSGGLVNPPSCFISYAWSTPDNDAWVTMLARDLKEAGIKVILDRRDNAAIGSNIARFISRIETSDFIVVVGTPLYMEKYLNRISATGSVAAAEVDLINSRLLATEEEKNTVLPLLREGEPKSALPPLMRGRVCGNFQREENYLESLFDLILTLYGIAFDHPTAEDFRESLRGRA